MRIGIVNDLPMVAEALRRVLTREASHEVAWVAANGAEAVQLCRQDTPTLILMDLLMPVMDGVEATRQIMSETPCAILLVTASIDANVPRVFEAMGYGALDAIDTPVLGLGDSGQGSTPLLRRIAALGKLINDDVTPHPLIGRTAPVPASRPSLVAIGASAGGPAAIAMILRGLPADFPAAVVVIQHVDEQFIPGMATWLQHYAAMPVLLAKEDDVPRQGAVLLAATGNHLTFKTPGRLGYTAEPRDYVYRPSVDVFFHSVAALWQGVAIGVLLTGMGRDGAQGLKALRDNGHYTIAQDQATSAVYGMPKAAAALGAAVDVLPLKSIASRLIDAVADQTHSESRGEGKPNV
jgi:two-component system, chemotaxis family, response regulator WspF